MKPILFNTEMVRAILDGRKTVTRRVVKPQPVCYGKNIAIPKHDGDFFLSAEKKWIRCRECGHDPEYSRECSDVSHHWVPPYLTSDILYVRETFGFDNHNWLYKADFSEKDLELLKHLLRWRSSIHMPKEAARIFLRVTDVRVERLCDIENNNEEAKREGFDWKYIDDDFSVQIPPWVNFAVCWDDTIKKSDLDRYGLDANPWVWVIEFERVEKAEVIHNG